ncbi:hypothetical protein ISN76_04570 [Dyella halodurans]|uniref:Uncharacterized protein n=1 Tax=Dyella halodurans TaxID=1920171 RepID=A0ABV9BXY3_9GAMM|nr:hypothetical protein [Dyella halodurans]
MALWRPLRDTFAEGILNAPRQQGLLRTPARSDGHIVDHSTAYFPGQRFPNRSDLYRRTRSVTRRLNEFGITEDTQEPMLVQAGRRDPSAVRAWFDHRRCRRDRLTRLPLAED